MLPWYLCQSLAILFLVNSELKSISRLSCKLYVSAILLLLLLLFWDRVSLCSPDCPGACYVDRPDWFLTHGALYVSASWVLGLMTWPPYSTFCYSKISVVDWQLLNLVPCPIIQLQKEDDPLCPDVFHYISKVSRWLAWQLVSPQHTLYQKILSW